MKCQSQGGWSHSQVLMGEGEWGPKQPAHQCPGTFNNQFQMHFDKGNIAPKDLKNFLL